MENSDWSIAVFSCKPENVENTVVDFYQFVKGIDGVKDLHFIVRDRCENEVIFSFRVFLDQKHKDIIESKMAYKLKTLIPEDKFSINPADNHPFAKYAAWSPAGRAKNNPEKFVLFCNYLSRLSRLVVDMAENKYFDSAERVELAHVMPWMLGFTEYGSLSPKQMQIGYYDRVTDKYHIHVRQNFEK